MLIDFGHGIKPCRRENQIKYWLTNTTITKFVNGNGFEIYSISLDKNSKAWNETIKR